MRPPSPGNWSSRYGWRGEGITRNFHHGLDIGWAAGRTLVAPEDGEITHYGVVPGWRLGNVQIIHGVSGYEHWLCHTAHSLRGLGSVREGQPVSVMGDTGALPGQVHVHWETRLDGARLDPEAWLARPAVDGSTPFIPATPDRKDPIMNWVQSEQTGYWYAIYEFTATKITDHADAVLVSHSIGRDSERMPSADVKVLLRLCEARAAAFSSELAAKVRATIAQEG